MDGILFPLLLTVHILVGATVIGLVLLQHGKGADMGAAFGGGASGSLFGAEPEAWLLGIRGYHFDEFVEELSAPARANLAAAVGFVRAAIRDGAFLDSPSPLPGLAGCGVLNAREVDHV